jgi:hypothetical protein
MDSELENRLNELFSEEDSPAKPSRSQEKSAPPLAELKKAVLSIDWEITPEAIDGFLDQIRLLKEAFQKDKTVFSFFQILGSLGEYIKSKRGQAHPNTFSLLNSVFASLEEILSGQKMSEPDKRKRLQAEMQKYQQLRDKIIRRRSVETKPVPQPAAGADTAPEPPATVSATELARALQDLKEFIRSEFKSLRESLADPARRP